jgi:hypothetical protein
MNVGSGGEVIAKHRQAALRFGFGPHADTVSLGQPKSEPVTIIATSSPNDYQVVRLSAS